MKTEIYPKVNMPIVSQKANKERLFLLKFVPQIDMAVIDYGRMAEIDAFYTLCQRHRDFYKDPNAKMNPIAYFSRAPKKFQTKPDPTAAYLARPRYFTQATQPIVYPSSAGGLCRSAVRFTGRYDKESCAKYKR